MPLIPALGRQRQADLCKFKASLVYRVSPRTAKAITQRNPISKNKTEQNKRKQNKGWGYRSEQRILSKGNSNGCCKALKEIFRILSHQENVNQNYFEVPSYTCQNGYDPLNI